jgi:hypothetical protein
MKIAIVTAVWRRHDIFELFAKGIHELEKIKGVELITIVAGSERELSKRLVEKHNFLYIEIPNQPLAEKVNAPLLLAKDLNVDYVLCLGSDDIIHPDLMLKYIELMKQGLDFIGVLDFYFYDTNTKKCAYWGGYRGQNRSNHTCGAGRILSKRLLNLWGWHVWENKQSNMLDNSMQDKLINTPHSSCIFFLKDYGLFALDIKSSVNMTQFKLWDNTKYIEKNIIFDKFKYLFNDAPKRIL